MAEDILLKAGGNIPDDELPSEFLQGMVNRRMQGYRKYGSAKDMKGWDSVGNIKDRVRLYEETGNTEWLMDAAVFAWLEFTSPNHDNAHFRATTSGESPGSLLAGGGRSQGKAAQEEAARVAYQGREGD